MAESSPIKRGPWPLGINNKASSKAVPAGALRDSVNLLPSADGVLRLRTGYELAMPGNAVRGAVSIGDHVIIADSDSLMDFDARTGSAVKLRTIAGTGRFAGAVLNEELFLCTENECLRYKSGLLRAWGVPTVTAQPVPTIGAGALRAGTYQVAATYLDATGDEGGTTAALTVTVPEGASLVFQAPVAPPGYRTRLYVGACGGATLYLQHEGSGPYVCSRIDDSSARLETQNLRAPVPGDRIEAHNGVLLIADGNLLHMTMPLRPHLRSAIKGWFRFPARVDLVISADGGVFVSADKTYFLTDIESQTPTSRTVFDFGAVAGSETSGPRGEAMWMTPYGLAKSDGAGGALLVSEANFVPDLAGAGSSTFLESDGCQMAVTTLKTQKGQNPLAASDTYDMEMIYP